MIAANSRPRPFVSKDHPRVQSRSKSRTTASTGAAVVRELTIEAIRTYRPRPARSPLEQTGWPRHGRGNSGSAQARPAVTSTRRGRPEMEVKLSIHIPLPKCDGGAAVIAPAAPAVLIEAPASGTHGSQGHRTSPYRPAPVQIPRPPQPRLDLRRNQPERRDTRAVHIGDDRSPVQRLVFRLLSKDCRRRNRLMSPRRAIGEDRVMTLGLDMGIGDNNDPSRPIGTKRMVTRSLQRPALITKGRPSII